MLRALERQQHRYRRLESPYCKSNGQRIRLPAMLLRARLQCQTAKDMCVAVALLVALSLCLSVERALNALHLRADYFVVMVCNK